AAGINFSLRAVALTAESYKRDGQEVPLRPDEILQMFGRAGRRGIDETGYVLVSPEGVRLRDAQPAVLARSALVDWSALLGLMAAAVDQGRDPFAEAVRVQQRLFTTRPIFLGVEESLKNPVTPCGLKTDAERARHVHRRAREILNSRGEWEPFPVLVEKPLGEIRVADFPESPASLPGPDGPPAAAAEAGPVPPAAPPAPVLPAAPNLRPLLTEAAALEKMGTGGLAHVATDPAGHRLFGRSLIVADRQGTDRVQLAKWVRRLTGWHGREAAIETWHGTIAPLVEARLGSQRFPVLRFDVHPHHVVALVSLADQRLRVPVDRHGLPLWRPREREVFPPDCAKCELTATCRSLSAGTGTALLWRRLGLVNAQGAPTRRGRVVSCFQGGDGLAVAAALEDESYPLDELVYDLANLDAGFRFCSDDSRWGGRLAMVCRAKYGSQSLPGYLECGVPPKYGDGAHLVVRTLHPQPHLKHRFVTEFLGAGDIDRVIIEWRSLLRQIAHANPLEWARWTELQALARTLLHEVHSPTETTLPPLDYAQTK
ncbi:MAG: DEAD/DEAH box helicase, partial [Verrucomicrobiota bacterium]